MKQRALADYQALNTSREVVITAKDLPLQCPLEEQSLWCAHPRVVLAIETCADRTYRCPYCGTLYRLLA